MRHLPDNYILRLFGRAGNLESLAADLISKRKVEFVGMLNDDELSAYYDGLDCVVHTEEFAGWSNLAAEALACGVPLICTIHGTLAFAEHNVTAIVVEPTAEAIRLAIEKLFINEELANRLSRNGRDRIACLTWECYAQELMALVHFDGRSHYTYAPELGLFGKWSIKTRLRGIESLLKSCSNKTVVDLGTGEGVIALEFLKNGAACVHGFDIDPLRLEEARRICSDYPNSLFRPADLSCYQKFRSENYDLLKDRYDIVLYLGLQHHLPKQTRIETLIEASRLARDFFLVRTTEKTYAEDDIHKRLHDERFSLHHAVENQKDDFLGPVCIFERMRPLPKGTIKISDIKRQFISYPKSGRTWIRYILSRLGVEKKIVFHHDTFEYNDGSKPPPQLDFSIRLQKVKNIDKIVYLARDPRDIMVSLFFQITGRFRDFFSFNGSISEFIRDDYFGAKNLKLFRDQWDAISSSGYALKVTYEDCHSDLLGVMRSILEYYEIDYSEENLTLAISDATFSKMREVEQHRTFELPWLRPRNSSFKMRKGIIGGFHDHLGLDDILYLNNCFGIKNN